MAERRIVTVVFADVVGFTSLSEQLDPEDVATVQDAYFASVREVLERYGGLLEKFIGDAAVAVFGLPRTRDDDAERAVRAGLALHRGVAALGAQLGLEPGALVLRVGINTGDVAHTPAPSGIGRVTGDAVNVAARLQAAAEPGRVLVGPDTALAVAAAFELEPAGALDLKGKAEALRAHVVRGERARPSREAALGRLRAETIGREAELEGLQSDLATAESVPGTTLVVAPPGVGKSRLVAEFVRRATSGDLPVRVWRTVVDATDAPFAPIAELVRDALRSSGVALDDAEGGAALLGERLGAAGVGAAREVAAEVVALVQGRATPTELDARVGAWLTALRVLEGSARAVWVVEDAHHASPEALGVLERASAAADAARLIVVTARPPILTRAPQWVAGVHRRLDLVPLPTTSTVELVRALAGDRVPDELVDRIAEVADGTPLFVEELLRMWLAVGVLREHAGGLDVVAHPDTIVVPTTIRALYTAQLDDLPDAVRQVAQRGAVVGDTFAVSAVRALGSSEVDDGTQGLKDRSLVDGPTVDGTFGASYAYRHALLADAAYQSLTRRERGDLHVALAAWLTSLPEADVLSDAIAHHYDVATTQAPALATHLGGLARDEVVRRARAWRARAATEALEASAFGTAAAHARRLAELAEPGSFEAATAHRLLGSALASSDDISLGIDELNAAIVAFRALHVAATSPEGQGADGEAAQAADGWARTAAALSHALYDQIGFDHARDVADEALRELAGSLDPVAEGHLLAQRTAAVSAQMDASTPQRFRDDAWRALKAAEDADDPLLELAALRAILVSDDRTSDEIAELLRRRESTARRVGQWREHAEAARHRRMLEALDDPAASVAALEELASLTGSLGIADSHAFMLYSLAEVNLARGDWDRAIDLAREAITTGRRHGAFRAMIRSLFLLAPIAGRRADDELAQEVVDGIAELVDVLPATVSPFATVMLDAVATVLERDIAVVTHAGVESVALVGPASIQMANETIVHRLIAQGQRRGLDDVVERGRGDALTGGRMPRMIGSSLELLQAWLRLAEGERDAAAQHARSALAMADDVGVPWWASCAIRVLEATGHATAADLEERIRIEVRLGIERPLPPPIT